MNDLFVVAVVLDDGHDSMTQGFVFADEDEAEQFRDHMRDYYGYTEAEVIAQGIDTYDSAIQHVVDAIGPSPDEDWPAR